MCVRLIGISICAKLCQVVNVREDEHPRHIAILLPAYVYTYIHIILYIYIYLTTRMCTHLWYLIPPLCSDCECPLRQISDPTNPSYRILSFSPSPHTTTPKIFSLVAFCKLNIRQCYITIIIFSPSYSTSGKLIIDDFHIT